MLEQNMLLIIVTRVKTHKRRSMSALLQGAIIQTTTANFVSAVSSLLVSKSSVTRLARVSAIFSNPGIVCTSCSCFLRRCVPSRVVGACVPTRMDTTHLGALPEHAARTMPVDLILMAEGQEFPAHRFVLGVNSAVFAEIFSEAGPSSSLPSDQLRIPLVEDAAKDVRTALIYFYRGCAVMSPSKPELQSVEDAVSLAKFAHKYDVKALVREAYLVVKAQERGGSALFANTEAVVSMLITAESCRMDSLQAHCELFMIKLPDKGFWQHPALMSERISRQCLLRLLRGAQYHTVSSEAQIGNLQAQVLAQQPGTSQPGTGGQTNPFGQQLGFGQCGSPQSAFSFGSVFPRIINDISSEEGRHVTIDTP